MNQDGQPTLWQRAIGPSARIQGDEERAAARLMAVLMLAHVAAVALGVALGDLFWRRTVGTTILRGWDAFGIVVAAGLIAVSFLLVRAGRYRTGVALYLACTTAVPLTVPFLGPVHYEIALLAAGIILLGGAWAYQTLRNRQKNDPLAQVHPALYQPKVDLKDLYLPVPTNPPPIRPGG